MGQKGVAILPTLKSDIEGIGHASTVMSAETVTAWSEMSNRIQQDAANMKAKIGNALIDLFGGWTANERAAKALNDQINAIETPEAFKELGAPTIPKNVNEIADGLEKSARGAMAANRETEAWNKTLDQMHETTFKLAMDHEKQWREETEKDLKTHNQAVIDGLNQTQAAQAKYFDYLDKATLDATDYQIKKIWERVNAEELAFKGTAEQRERYTAIVEAQADAETAALVAKLKEQTDAALASEAQQIAAINATTKTYYEKLDAIQAVINKTNEEQGLGGPGAVVGHRPGEPGSELHAGADIPNGGTNWGSPSGVAGSFIGSTIEARLKALADEMARYPNTPINVSNLFAGLTGFGQGGSGDFGSGTPVMLHGREAIVPLDTQGSDLRFGGSAGQVGGAITLTINITQPLGTPEQIARAVGDAQIALLKGQGVRLPYGA
jgi:phosphohistidine swiveling domain-containing protein